ncbi:Mfa1 family fimbria major subunit [Porphyromonas levii]|uniref:Mfa1 family fimbria major subunit n=1 Tax=Porphyromonas levii TaxID=28114 RepID=UPI001B8C3BE4|nr:Mfa1 family fimbria major subunit [Porphyromonas levii]MBR8760314.1 Minor fimbrium subunit Mfa1 [Porphyromonas levii]
MKRILTIGAIFALALGFASCNKNKSNIPDTPTQEGTTYMSLTFRLPAESGTRAEDKTNNDIGQWEGRDKFENVDVYLVTDGAKSVEKKSLKVVSKATSTADGVYKTESWKTTPGEKTVYVVVNNGGDIKAALDAATVTNFAKVYNEAYEMLKSGKVKADYASASKTEDIIMMTGQPVKQKINDGISQDKANAAADTAGEDVDNNKVQVTVRRVVSRVSVSANNGLISDGVAQIETTDGTVIGTLKDLSWTPMQLEQTSYLLWQNVKEDGVDYTALATKSPSYSYVPVNSSYGTEAPNKYSYDRKDEALTIRPDFVRNAENGKNVSWITGDGNNMEFITENTHKDYRRGNTTYVKVTGTFVPDAGTWAEGEKAKYEEELATNPTPSIYWGATTGKFYFDKTTATKMNPVSEEAAKAKKDGIIEFKAGKMYYFAWINPDKTDHLKWTTSPVVRNNIYHINISAFKNVGLYRNPYDPEDPTDPDPDDPDPKDPDDPLNDKETYMVTEVTVINWGMHSYDVEF